MVSTATVVRDKEFQAIMPALSAQEYDLLRASIKREGCRDPLVVWAEAWVLLDGYNRLSVCEELSVPYKVKELSFADREEAKRWIVRNQLGRRNLFPYQRARLALLLEDEIRSEAVSHRNGARAIVPEKRINTNAKIGQAAGLSGETIRQARFIRDHAPASTLAALEAGTTKIGIQAKKLMMLRNCTYQRYRKALMEISNWCRDGVSDTEAANAMQEIAKSALIGGS